MYINAQKVKKLNKMLDSVQDDYQMIGYHMEAIDSIFRYPQEYKLGKEAATAVCKFCGKRPLDLHNAESIMFSGACISCDDLRVEYEHDAIGEVETMMGEMGLDPQDASDCEYFMEGY
jgi:hypothetical protein